VIPERAHASEAFGTPAFGDHDELPPTQIWQQFAGKVKSFRSASTTKLDDILQSSKRALAVHRADFSGMVWIQF
jgi:hypothetical protein